MTIASQISADVDQMVAASGDSATLTHGGVTGAAFNGLFDNEYFGLDVGAGVSSAKPAFAARTPDVSSAVKGDTLTVTSVLYGITAQAYTIQERQASPADLGPGMTRLILKL